MAKIKVAVLFGGISAEHEISITSANSVMENIDTEKFKVIPIFISKDGKFNEEKVKSAEVVFSVLHGKGGEDGEIQKYLESIGKKYVGSGPKASALTLDKIASKQIWQKLGLPIPSFQFFNKKQWQENPLPIMQKIDPPVFIKPANTGSSIGITKVKKKSQIKEAVEKALIYHDEIIVEKALKKIHDIEISVLGNDNLIVSNPGEIIPADEFYSYNAKYKLDSKLIISARLSKNKILEIQDLAEKAYRALGCRGFARVDFFLKRPGGKIYLNEINTIPGFTKISMFPKMMAAAGIPYKELLTKIIELGLEK